MDRRGWDVAVTVLVARLMTETVQLPSGWAVVGAAHGRLGLPLANSSAAVGCIPCERLPCGVDLTGTVAK
jgi:hypothetical protein